MLNKSLLLPLGQVGNALPSFIDGITCHGLLRHADLFFFAFLLSVLKTICLSVWQQGWPWLCTGISAVVLGDA